MDTVRYCDATYTEWEINHCILELTPEQQRRRGFAYRLVFHAGRLVRFDSINGRGFFDQEPPKWASDEYTYVDGHITKVLEKDRNGLVRGLNVPSADHTWFRWLDAVGRPSLSGALSGEDNSGKTRASGFKRQHDARGRVISYKYVDANAEPTPSEEGVVEVRVQRDERGALIDEAFFDEQGRPAWRKDGVHRIVHEVNAQELQVLDRYLDPLGHPAARTDGVHTIQRVFDPIGNLVECSYHRLDGHLMRSSEDGAASFRLTRDEHGGETARTYFDESDQPTLSAYGYVTRRKRLDAHGLPVEWSFFDAHGKPMRVHGTGHSIMLRTLDERARTVLERYFDVDGLPMTLPGGYQRAETGYDERDNPVLTSYKDADGNLTVIRDGYAIVRRDYDVDRLIRVRYLDAKGDAVNAALGYSELRIEYGALGEQSSTKRLRAGAPADPP